MDKITEVFRSYKYYLKNRYWYYIEDCPYIMSAVLVWRDFIGNNKRKKLLNAN